MTNAITCGSYEASGALARYVAGTLDSECAQEFENHFLTCERCQRSIAAGSVVNKTDRPQPRRSTVSAWALTAAAASVAAVLIVRTVQHPSISELGRVVSAPAYVGMPVRAQSDVPAVLFDSAMTAYNRGEYVASSSLLTQLNRIAPDDVAVMFFLGASQIVLERAADAEASFTAVIAAGPTQYRGEALYYRALALLQLNRKREAVSDLRAALAADPAIATQASDLLRRLGE